jgi:transcriptional antiterminator NusG
VNYKDWYCVQVASGCEKKAKADLLARRAVIDDRAILEVEVPERTELTFDKAGKRKAVKNKVLPGYILVRVAKTTIEQEDGTEARVFPPETRDTIMSTFNVLGFAGADRKVPRMMRPSEIKHIFEMVDETHLEVKQNVQVDYNIGDILDVVHGPFSGNKVEVTGIQGNKVLGQLELFGRIISAEFTTQQLYKENN